MNQEMTEQIAETKELVNAAEWREKILSCQESGKPVTAWCEENGISPSTYYRKLRMMREDILSGEQQIVPIKPRVPHGIRITAGEISILNLIKLRKADKNHAKSFIPYACIYIVTYFSGLRNQRSVYAVAHSFCKK